MEFCFSVSVKRRQAPLSFPVKPMSTGFVFPKNVLVHPLVLLKAEQARIKVVPEGGSIICVLLGSELSGGIYITNAFPYVQKAGAGDFSDSGLSVMATHYTSIYDNTWVVGWLSYGQSKGDNSDAEQLFGKFKPSRMIQLIYEDETLVAKMWMSIGVGSRLSIVDSSIPNDMCRVGTNASNEMTALKALGLSEKSADPLRNLKTLKGANFPDVQDVYTLLSASYSSAKSKHSIYDDKIRKTADLIVGKK